LDKNYNNWFFNLNLFLFASHLVEARQSKSGTLNKVEITDLSSKELFTYFYRENIHFIMKARFIENKKVNLLFLIYIMYMVFH